MLVATSDEKVRLCAITQLTFAGKPYRFFTMLHSRSCKNLPNWLAVSVCVSAVAGYALKAVLFALECFPLMVVVKEFVAHVAIIAYVAVVTIVIDMKRGMMLSSTSWLLPNITLITFIALLTLISVVSSLLLAETLIIWDR